MHASPLPHAAAYSAFAAAAAAIKDLQQPPGPAIWWRTDSTTALGSATVSMKARRDQGIAHRLRAHAALPRQKAVPQASGTARPSRQSGWAQLCKQWTLCSASRTATGRRRALFDSTGCDSAFAQQLSDEFTTHRPMLLQWGVPEPWSRMAADLHRGSWMAAAGSSDRVRNFTGVRPGDPLADLVFNFTFLLFQRKLADLLAHAECDLHIPCAGASVFPGPET